jgi:hypothetical protein
MPEVSAAHRRLQARRKKNKHHHDSIGVIILESWSSLFQNPEKYKVWRTLLCKELGEWYTDHQPSSKKRKSISRIADVVDEEFPNVDMENFVDLLDVAAGAGGARAGVPAAAAALAAAASAAAAARAGASAGAASALASW